MGDAFVRLHVCACMRVCDVAHTSLRSSTYAYTRVMMHVSNKRLMCVCMYVCILYVRIGEDVLHCIGCVHVNMYMCVYICQHMYIYIYTSM